jgi:hypothetical protein
MFPLKPKNDIYHNDVSPNNVSPNNISPNDVSTNNVSGPITTFIGPLVVLTWPNLS